MDALGATLAPVNKATVAENKQHFAVKATQATAKISMGFLTTTVSPELRSKTIPGFVATYITPSQALISKLDERTSKFFHHFMNEIIHPAMEQFSPLVNPLFERFARESGNAQIKKQFIEGLALPHVNNMIAELDAVTLTIIDDIIAAQTT